MDSNTQNLDRTDGELLDQYRRGHNPAALTELLARYRPRVLSVARKWLWDRSLADDVFQDTAQSLLRHAGAIREPEAVGRWLRITAYRSALAMNKRLPERLTDAPQELPSDPPPDPLEQREVAAALWEILGREKELDVRLAVGYYVHGTPVKKLAQSHGLTVNAVDTRLCRFRQRLRANRRLKGLALASLLALLVERNPARAATPTAKTSLVLGGWGWLAAAVIAVATAATVAVAVQRKPAVADSAPATGKPVPVILEGSEGK